MNALPVAENKMTMQIKENTIVENAERVSDKHN